MEQNGIDQAHDKPANDSESILKRLAAYAEVCEKKGVFPYDGQWLSADEIDEQIRRKHLKSRTHLLELGSLFALVYVFAILMGLLLSKFTY